MRLQLDVSRRALVIAAALACQPSARRAFAESGQWANVAPPAMVPSPIRPTGEMALTCEVVALGREDVCLEYKKVLTSYDLLQLGKTKDALGEERSGVDPTLKALIDDLSALLPLVEANEFMAIDGRLPSIAAAAASDKKLKADYAKLAAAQKAREASPVARATIKLAQDLLKLVDGVPAK